MTPPRISRAPASDLPMGAGSPGCDPHPPAVSPVSPAGGSPVPLAGSASRVPAPEGAAGARAESPVRSVSSASAADRAGSKAVALLASLMPENGGRESLDYKLRKMLDDDFPHLLRQHNSDSRRAHAGFPDWVIAGPGGVLVRELKRESTKPTPAQVAWLDAFSAAGFDCGIWRPSSLLNGDIARELTTLAGMGGSR